MKLYRPQYCEDFKCIADKCRHSCCIGWEISVDNATFNKYNSLGREDILCHIHEGQITLCEGGRCPFLCPDGLCSIISELSEEYTSLICREHPRFYHRVGDRVEGGIGLSCEEAARLILSSDSYSSFTTCEHTPEIAEETDFDSIPHRDFIYSLLSDRGVSYDGAVALIKEKYSLLPIHTLEEWSEIFSGLEYLDDAHRDLFTLRGKRGPYTDVYRRLLAYFLFRQLSPASSYENLRARLGLCLLLTELFEGLTEREDMCFEEICELARIISEEIEYSEDNTAELIFELEANIL